MPFIFRFRKSAKSKARMMLAGTVPMMKMMVLRKTSWKVSSVATSL